MHNLYLNLRRGRGRPRGGQDYTARASFRGPMPGPADPASPVRDVALHAPCPMCGAANLRMRSLSMDIPYFGEALQTTVLCEACGFRHADVLLAGGGAPPPPAPPGGAPPRPL